MSPFSYSGGDSGDRMVDWILPGTVDFHGRQQLQRHCQLMIHQTSPLLLSSLFIWAEEEGDGLGYLAACLVGEGVLL